MRNLFLNIGTAMLFPFIAIAYAAMTAFCSVKESIDDAKELRINS